MPRAPVTRRSRRGRDNQDDDEAPKKKTEVTELVVISSDESTDDENAPIAERLERLRKKRAETTLAAEVLKGDVERLEELYEQEKAAERARAQKRHHSPSLSPTPGPSRRQADRSPSDTDRDSVAERVQKKRRPDTGWTRSKSVLDMQQTITVLF